MRTRTKSKPHGASLLLALLAASALTGCKEAPEFGTQDPSKLATLVVSVNDSTRDLKKLGQLYASSAQPAEKDRAGMKGMSFRLAEGESPVIEGDKATMKVNVKDAQDTITATATWTAVKEGDAWKLTSTPLK